MNLNFMTLLLIPLTLVSTSSHANLSLALHTSDPKPEEITRDQDNPPENLENWVTLDEVRSEFAKKIPVSETTLLGQWRIVFLKNAQNACQFGEHKGPEPLMNGDKTFPTYQFAWKTQSSLNGPINVLVVELQNLGADEADQGPYKVSAGEPQFSRYGYVRNKISNEAWFSHRCRGVESRQDLMVCAVRMNLKEGFGNDEDKTCAKEETAEFYILQKQ